MLKRNRILTVAPLLLVLLCSLSFAPVYGQFYDGSNMSFGKNRIQHKEFLWQYYRFDNYDTYFYEGGKDIAEYISEIAPYHIQDLQNKLDYVIQERIEFIVYNTQSDYRQSNLGMSGIEGDPEIGGTAQIAGTKVFVYYEGDHESLIRNLRSGIARLLIRDLLYGGDWKEVVKNSALLNLPNWYTEGLVSYLIDDWTPEIKDRVADGIRHGHYSKFNRLTDGESVFAGFSIWKYIADVYGPSVIPNILYMTHLSRSIESGFVFVIGVPLDRLFEEHRIYYGNYFVQQSSSRRDPVLEPIAIKTKKERAYSQFKLSPNGKQAALVSNELGQYRILLFDVDEFRRIEAARKKDYEKDKAVHDRKEKAKQQSKEDYKAKPYKPYTSKPIKPKKVYKAEHKLDRIVDRSYPVLEWNPRGTELAFITESKGTLWLNLYSLEDKKVYPRELFGLDKVLSFDFSSNGTQLLMSGVSEGYTDLYRYYLVGNRQEQLTADIYDDLEPRFVKEGQGVIFSSNRTNDTLGVSVDRNPPADTKDIFIMDFADRGVFERITSTPAYNEISPDQYDSLTYTFLGEQDLIYDRYLAQYDSVISRIDTAIHYRYFTNVNRLSKFESNPLEVNVLSKRKEYTQLDYENRAYRFRIGKFADDDRISDAASLPGSPNNSEVEIVEDNSRIPVTVTNRIPVVEGELDVQDYVFLGEDASQDTMPVDEGPVIIEDIEEIIAIQSAPADTAKRPLPKPRNYKLNFAVDQADLDLTNSFTFDFYQAYRQDNQNLSPGFSPAMSWGLSDLFEDKHILGSIGFLGGINDLAYGVKYDNLTKRLDKALMFQRQSSSYTISVDNVPVAVRSHSHMMRYQMSYPFSEVFSLRGDLLGRYQRDVSLALDDISLKLPNQHSYLGGGKMQLVFDNTLDKGLNLLNGTRGKIWAEYYRNLDFENNEYPDFGVLGLDIRHYQKIHRDLLFAVRLAGNTSFGQERLISFLGGVDNWVVPSPRYDNSVKVDASQNYSYQALLMPLRGFYRNARNGTSALALNTEIRFPVFKYLLNRPIQSDFVENFQVLGFADVGSAWTGSGPYSDSNSFNQNEEADASIPVVVFVLKNQEDPILAGYGFGFRSRLLGYFIRADWAWGLVDGTTLPSEFYLSLNLDF